MKSIFELVWMQTMISNTKRNLVSSRASRKVDEGGNGKNDNDLHIMVSFVTKRDININIFRTTFNHHFLENILKMVYPIVFVPNIFPNSRLIQKRIHIWQLFWKMVMYQNRSSFQFGNYFGQNRSKISLIEGLFVIIS